MFHVYGFQCVQLHVLYLGAKVVTLPKFTPELYIDTLKNYKPTVLYTAPPIGWKELSFNQISSHNCCFFLVIFLTVHPDVKPEYLQTVKTVTSGAAPLGSEDEERFLAKVNQSVNILQGYIFSLIFI